MLGGILETRRRKLRGGREGESVSFGRKPGGDKIENTVSNSFLRYHPEGEEGGWKPCMGGSLTETQTECPTKKNINSFYDRGRTKGEPAYITNTPASR